MTTLSHPDEIALFRLCTLRTMLKLEIRGMTRTRTAYKRTAYAILKEELGLKGNKEKVLEQVIAIIEQRKKELGSL
jgi:hypothetical protein